jgi:hypothetical protein
MTDHYSQKVTIPKIALPTKIHKTPRKKRAPRGSLLDSDNIGTSMSNIQCMFSLFFPVLSFHFSHEAAILRCFGHGPGSKLEIEGPGRGYEVVVDVV